tara:strand:+ start:1358 stop:1981 length:624 start_codon:yes stop_codon:yes gene_type:complete
MSHMERNLDYLNKKRIIYRRGTINDKPSEVFDWGGYYELGTHEYYELFRSRAKITTFKSLKWHMLVLWYLNPQMNQDDFDKLSIFIANKSNGFVTFVISKQLLKTMIYEVSMMDLEEPPKNKQRKIIFNEFSGLNPKEKMSIVGKLIGRSKKINEDDIYQCMLDINDISRKITISNLASNLSCSARTIHRNMSNELKKEKELLNQQI